MRTFADRSVPCGEKSLKTINRKERQERKELDLRKSPNLYDELYTRMRPVYKRLPGYDPQLKSVPSAVYFVVGQEQQFVAQGVDNATLWSAPAWRRFGRTHDTRKLDGKRLRAVSHSRLVAACASTSVPFCRSPRILMSATIAR